MVIKRKVKSIIKINRKVKSIIKINRKKKEGDSERVRKRTRKSKREIVKEKRKDE